MTVFPDMLIAFEAQVKDLWEAGDLPYLTHLCGGNEKQLLEVFERVRPGDWVFASHRCHYHYLLTSALYCANWDAICEDLLTRIKLGQSMFLYNKAYNFISNAICAGNCAIAAGLAWTVQRLNICPTIWCFLGDGAEDEGHFYEAVRWVDGLRLPCTFVIEDNDRSCNTTKQQRIGTPHTAFWEQHGVKRYTYIPTWPHAGSGCSHHITFKEPAK